MARTSHRAAVKGNPDDVKTSSHGTIVRRDSFAAESVRQTLPLPARFRGKGGRKAVIEALRSQILVGGDRAIASRMVSAGLLECYRRGTVLSQQGDQNNDLLLVVTGEVSVRVNERELARRQAGTHVGEMALVDQLARRSATVVALEDTVVLTLSEPQFARLAEKQPDLWRRIAVEIAKRLRERNRFVNAPHNEPVFFIGSSSEGLDVATGLGKCLKKSPIVVRPWSDGVFQASMTSIESLIKMAGEADFAALVISPDDVTISRGKSKSSPRDNVVFELGLLMGSIGRERVFVLAPRDVDVRLPSDLLGVTCVQYGRSRQETLSVRLKQASKVILEVVRRLGPR